MTFPKTRAKIQKKSKILTPIYGAISGLRHGDGQGGTKGMSTARLNLLPQWKDQDCGFFRIRGWTCASTCRERPSSAGFSVTNRRHQHCEPTLQWPKGSLASSGTFHWLRWHTLLQIGGSSTLQLRCLALSIPPICICTSFNAHDRQTTSPMFAA